MTACLLNTQSGWKWEIGVQKNIKINISQSSNKSEPVIRNYVVHTNLKWFCVTINPKKVMKYSYVTSWAIFCMKWKTAFFLLLHLLTWKNVEKDARTLLHMNTQLISYKSRTIILKTQTMNLYIEIGDHYYVKKINTFSVWLSYTLHKLFACLRNHH